MELQIYADFFRRKTVDIKLHRMETVNLNDRMTEKREILVKAAIEKKVLETLKEKKVQAHKRELLDKERIFLEEISLRKNGHGK
jgi:flagellar FliJ protein